MNLVTNEPNQSSQSVAPKPTGPKDKSHTGRSWYITVVVTAAAIMLLIWAWHVHTGKARNTATAVQQVQRRDVEGGDVNGKVGTAVEVGGLKLTVNKMSVLANTADDKTATRKVDVQYVIADVTLEGTNKNSANFSAAQFSLLTAKETTAALSTPDLPVGIKTPLGTGSLKKGDKAVSGQVVLPLPAGFKYYYLVFTPLSGKHVRAVVSL